MSVNFFKTGVVADPFENELCHLIEWDSSKNALLIIKKGKHSERLKGKNPYRE